MLQRDDLTVFAAQNTQVWDSGRQISKEPVRFDCKTKSKANIRKAIVLFETAPYERLAKQRDGVS